MKKMFRYVSVIAFAFSMFIVSCEKAGDDDAASGPDITYVTSGVLCTMGTGRNYVFDTLVVFPGAGIQIVREYAYGFTPPDEEVFISNNSNGTVSVRLKIPDTGTGGPYTHLGLYGSHLSTGPENFYPYQLKTVESKETEFIIKRNAGDGTRFTLESKAVPGYFMSTRHPGVQYQPNSTVESSLVFSKKKQEFFFLPK